MRYLLDTVAFLWSLDEQQNLNNRALAILHNRHEEVFLSPVVSWEMVIKVSRGKLKLSRPAEDMVQRAFAEFGVRALPITHSHSLAVAQLPPVHNDPFDRMLVAQARSEHMVLMTADPVLEKYPVETLWCAR
jgi:PIN domain nuclease of toxin-antitoxin system